MIPRLSHTASLSTAFLYIVLSVTACTIPTPLSRSYDDPYNSPTPDEVGPSSTRPDEEECIRTNSCAGLCKSDRDCEDDEFCYQSQCVSKNIKLEEDPPPSLGPK